MTGPEGLPPELQVGDVVHFLNPDGTPAGDYLIAGFRDDGTVILEPLNPGNGHP